MSIRMLTNLAQARDPTPVLIWIGVLIVAVVVLFAALMLVKRKLFGREKDNATDRGLFDDLRAMRDRGEITQAEYDATRKAMAARITGKPVAPKEKPKPDGPDRNTHG